MPKPKKTKQSGVGKERFEVLLEDMNSKFDVLIERTADIAPIKEDISVMKGDIESLKVDVDVIKVDLNVVKGDIKVMKSDIEVMKGDINVIKNDLKQKVDREEFKTLERRVAMLEARR